MNTASRMESTGEGWVNTNSVDIITAVLCEDKHTGVNTCYNATYMSRDTSFDTSSTLHSTVSETDWCELMVPYIAAKLSRLCSMQIYNRPTDQVSHTRPEIMSGCESPYVV